MNMTTHITKTLILTFLLVTAAACSESPEAQPGAANDPTVDHDDPAVAAEHDGDFDGAHLLVHKTPWCGCCTLWEEQAESAGFHVESREHENLNPIKQSLGVPPAQGSCHTAEVEGYFIEGHVPFEDIKRLLTERPDARGLTVPGMPIGSPGMEQGDRRQAFEVYLIDNQGNASVYNHYPASN